MSDYLALRTPSWLPSGPTWGQLGLQEEALRAGIQWPFFDPRGNRATFFARRRFLDHFPSIYAAWKPWFWINFGNSEVRRSAYKSPFWIVFGLLLVPTRICHGVLQDIRSMLWKCAKVLAYMEVLRQCVGSKAAEGTSFRSTPSQVPLHCARKGTRGKNQVPKMIELFPNGNKIFLNHFSPGRKFQKKSGLSIVLFFYGR